MTRTLLVCFILSISAVAADDAATVAERIAQTKAKLKSDDAAVRKAAIESLIHSDLSEKMLGEMRETLGDPQGDIRAVAATAIGNLGVEAKDAVPQLIVQLKSDKTKEARETAARALGRIGKAVPDEKRPIESLQAAGKYDSDSVTRVVALGALAMMNVELDKQIAAIRKFLHHDDALTRMKASHALGGIGLPAKAASAEIVEVLKQETDSHRRGYVARALGNVGDPAALPVLLAALETETDANAQGEMRGAIQRLGGKVPDKQ